MTSTVQVIVSSQSGLAQEVLSGRHQLIADEPFPVGTDTGPSPYELLLASLGACTSMPLRLYATRKGWDLQRIRARLPHFRIHAADCPDCETHQGYLERLNRQLDVTGSVEEGPQRWLVE